jgi:hypothetical protein
MFDKLREILQKAKESFDFEKKLDEDQPEKNDTYDRDSQIFDEKRRKTDEDIKRRQDLQKLKQSIFQSNEED